MSLARAHFPAVQETGVRHVPLRRRAAGSERRDAARAMEDPKLKAVFPWQMRHVTPEASVGAGALLLDEKS